MKPEYCALTLRLCLLLVSIVMSGCADGSEHSPQALPKEDHGGVLTASDPPPGPPPAGRGDAHGPPCAALSVSPEVLVAAWPAWTGKTVIMAARIERAVAFTKVVIVAGGHRFAVVLGPADIWRGTQRKIFTVMGSTSVRVHGRVLPELLLVDGPPCG